MKGFLISVMTAFSCFLAFLLLFGSPAHAGSAEHRLAAMCNKKLMNHYVIAHQLGEGDMTPDQLRAQIREDIHGTPEHLALLMLIAEAARMPSKEDWYRDHWRRCMAEAASANQ